MGETRIEWATHTSNWLAGCTRVSPACEHCYAERMSARLGSMPQAPDRYAGVVDARGRWTGRVQYDAEALRAAFEGTAAARSPRRVFVNSMSDTFHKNAPPESLVDLAEAIRRYGDRLRAGGHVLMLLTKRADRLLDWQLDHFPSGLPDFVWVGTTVEDQQRADDRIPELLAVEAKVRFLSCEPLLGPVDLRPHLPRPTGPWVTPPATWDEVCWPEWVPPETAKQIERFWSAASGRGPAAYAHQARCGSGWHDAPPGFGQRASLRMVQDGEPRVEGRYIHAWNNIGRVVDDAGVAHVVSVDTSPERCPWRRRVDWVIAGGESGPGARPMHPAWARALRDVCVEYVPFHFKQWGEFIPDDHAHVLDDETLARTLTGDLPNVGVYSDVTSGHRASCYRVGKHRAGRLLDGRTWDQVPGGAP